MQVAVKLDIRRHLWNLTVNVFDRNVLDQVPSRIARADSACMRSVRFRPASRADVRRGEPTPARLLAAAKSWGFQLHKLDPDTLAAAPYDMLVIDYSRDGKAALALTPEQVDKIRIKPDGERRIVLAYLSIGEAETYRYYWKWYWGWFFGVFAPRWLGSEDPEWPGNYSVRYWQEGWQKIIFGGEDGYLERIVKAGFDGVYLDRVDAYVDMAMEKRNARGLMIAFVKALAERARALKPGFLIVPQNAEALLTDASYRAVIDGLGTGGPAVRR